MRRITLLLGTLLVVPALYAQQQSDLISDQQNAPQEDQRQDSGVRDPLLDAAPQAVKEQVIRHAVAGKLQELSASQWNGMNIYEALFQGENTQTRLRLGPNGAPISMYISGNGSQMNETAGANRTSNAQSQQTGSSQQQAPSRQQAQTEQSHAGIHSGERIDEAAGAKRDSELQKLQTQGPAETQGIPNAIRQRIQQQLGDTAVEEIQPKVFYQLNIRQNGNLQQIWADDKGTLLKPQQ